ncbi:ABC transporter ATP-binding protein [Methylobacillus flagellatus]|uniref:ABC transporter related protein n=1 Tax=Methylobacillus flagellatus (strain ATCC 51484 / DSM 6875 / VKM B-1610 / KT) TaxID=265072 RepID=Q1GYN1_METFK|nr:ATP-binding cassette domain-containing protein [Methylobacillus flagellatus]ABE50656.1 ABC transporter related protein [Methylobacillus flagellatus KT]
MSAPELKLQDLAVRDGKGNWLVHPCSFTLQPGIALSIIGGSGSGKSLLVQAIMGSLAPGLKASGEIRLGNAASRAEDAAGRRPWWGHTLAMLPQEPWLALNPSMRAGNQVAESYHYVSHARMSMAQARAQARIDLDQLGVAAADRQYPFMLSGGMAQRVAFAATRAGGAQVVIVDEPTKGLDADARDNLLTVLQSVLQNGGSVLTITHDMHVAKVLGGDIMVMRDSHVLEQGPAQQILEHPQHAYTRALLAADPEHWIQPIPVAGTGQQILEARGLSKRYGAHTLFSGIDLEIHAGERIAISGPSGAGKTTLGNMLLGLVPPDQGSIVLAPNIEKLKLQKLYQDPVSAFAPRLALRQAFDDLIRRHKLNPATLPRLLARLKLDEGLLRRLPSQVSGGELQRLALARILLLSPALIFADEPTSRLDPISQRETMDLLLEMAATNEAAILLVTHDRRLASRTMQRQIALRPV